MTADIRQALIDVINQKATHIQEAHRTDRSEFDGYPAAIISPSENIADYHQTAPESNREVDIFTIRLHYAFTEGQDEADIALEKASDELRTILRKRNILGNACDWIEPVPSVWGYQDRSDGTMRIAELTVRAVTFVEPTEDDES